MIVPITVFCTLLFCTGIIVYIAQVTITLPNGEIHNKKGTWIQRFVGLVLCLIGVLGVLYMAYSEGYEEAVIVEQL